MARYRLYKTNADGSPDDLVLGTDDKQKALREAQGYPRDGGEDVYVVDGETGVEILRLNAFGSPKLTVVGEQ